MNRFMELQKTFDMSRIKITSLEIKQDGPEHVMLIRTEIVLPNEEVIQKYGSVKFKLTKFGQIRAVLDGMEQQLKIAACSHIIKQEENVTDKHKMPRT